MVLGVTGCHGACAANLAIVVSKLGSVCVTSQNLTLVDCLAQETALIHCHAIPICAVLLVSPKWRGYESDSSSETELLFFLSSHFLQCHVILKKPIRGYFKRVFLASVDISVIKKHWIVYQLSRHWLIAN